MGLLCLWDHVQVLRISNEQGGWGWRLRRTLLVGHWVIRAPTAEGASQHPDLELLCLGEEGVEALTNLESPHLGRGGNSLPWPLVFMFLVGWWALEGSGRSTAEGTTPPSHRLLEDLGLGQGLRSQGCMMA